MHLRHRLHMDQSGKSFHLLSGRLRLLCGSIVRKQSLIGPDQRIIGILAANQRKSRRYTVEGMNTDNNVGLRQANVVVLKDYNLAGTIQPETVLTQNNSQALKEILLGPT